VNVYSVVTLLSIAGLQRPVIPLLEIKGNAGIVAPEQYGPTASKVGVTLSLTITLVLDEPVQPEASVTVSE
jgi:hypothetical protein